MAPKPVPKAKSLPVAVRELKTKEEWLAMYGLIRQSNRKMSRRQFENLLIEMLAHGYRCAGAYSGGKLVGVAGFWIGYRFWCRKYIDVDNVVVDEKLRGKGIGRKLMRWIEKEGRRLNCESAHLDCYTSLSASHRFYFREGYTIIGYHFIKDL